MASFQQFKDNALSYLVVTMIAGIGYNINKLNDKMDILLEKTTANTVRIESLERDVYKTSGVNAPIPPYKLPLQVKMIEMVGIRPEHDNKVRKYLTKI